MGAPTPNAWLGGLKNVDLVLEGELHISLKD
jgi:ethanolamine utilization protein EutQ (cupin superfamily)